MWIFNLGKKKLDRSCVGECCMISNCVINKSKYLCFVGSFRHENYNSQSLLIKTSNWEQGAWFWPGKVDNFKTSNTSLVLVILHWALLSDTHSNICHSTLLLCQCIVGLKGKLILNYKLYLKRFMSKKIGWKVIQICRMQILSYLIHILEVQISLLIMYIIVIFCFTWNNPKAKAFH